MLLAGCGGGGEEKPDRLGDGAGLASRLPTDDALNIAIVNVDAVRHSLGMPEGAAPPTGSQEDDQAFLAETNPALGIMQNGDVPTAISDALVARADAVASVTGDRAVTAISTSRPTGQLRGLLTAAGLQEEDDATWVAEDGSYAIALADDVIAVAESPGDARSAIERTDGEIPRALEQIQGDGQLVTLARFGASCLDSIGTSDSLHRPGEIAFFTSATPNAAHVVTLDDPASEPVVEGESARVGVHTADDPSEEPPALKALEAARVDYDCDG